MARGQEQDRPERDGVAKCGLRCLSFLTLMFESLALSCSLRPNIINHILIRLSMQDPSHAKSAGITYNLCDTERALTSSAWGV